MVKHEIVFRYLDLLRLLVKSGDIGGRLLNQYEAYVDFCKNQAGPKMQRYENTATNLQCSIRSVMDAVKSMETPVDDLEGFAQFAEKPTNEDTE